MTAAGAIASLVARPLGDRAELVVDDRPATRRGGRAARTARGRSTRRRSPGSRSRRCSAARRAKAPISAGDGVAVGEAGVHGRAVREAGEWTTPLRASPTLPNPGRRPGGAARRCPEIWSRISRGLSGVQRVPVEPPRAPACAARSVDDHDVGLGRRAGGRLPGPPPWRRSSVTERLLRPATFHHSVGRRPCAAPWRAASPTPGGSTWTTSAPRSASSRRRAARR